MLLVVIYAHFIAHPVHHTSYAKNAKMDLFYQKENVQISI